jgi:hypothetical protein
MHIAATHADTANPADSAVQACDTACCLGGSDKVLRVCRVTLCAVEASIRANIDFCPVSERMPCSPRTHAPASDHDCCLKFQKCPRGNENGKSNYVADPACCVQCAKLFFVISSPDTETVQPIADPACGYRTRYRTHGLGC